MKKTIVALALIALSFGLAACEKAAQPKKTAPTVKAVPRLQPTPSPSKWVGRWTDLQGRTAYVIQSEKGGALFGYQAAEGNKRASVTMKILNDTTASWITPVGVEVRFLFRGKNEIMISAAGIAASILRVVK